MNISAKSLVLSQSVTWLAGLLVSLVTLYNYSLNTFGVILQYTLMLPFLAVFSNIGFFNAMASGYLKDTDFKNTTSIYFSYICIASVLSFAVANFLSGSLWVAIVYFLTCWSTFFSEVTKVFLYRDNRTSVWEYAASSLGLFNCIFIFGCIYFGQESLAVFFNLGGGGPVFGFFVFGFIIIYFRFKISFSREMILFGPIISYALNSIATKIINSFNRRSGVLFLLYVSGAEPALIGFFERVTSLIVEKSKDVVGIFNRYIFYNFKDGGISASTLMFIQFLIGFIFSWTLIILSSLAYYVTIIALEQYYICLLLSLALAWSCLLKTVVNSQIRIGIIKPKLIFQINILLLNLFALMLFLLLKELLSLQVNDLTLLLMVNKLILIYCSLAIWRLRVGISISSQYLILSFTSVTIFTTILLNLGFFYGNSF